MNILKFNAIVAFIILLFAFTGKISKPQFISIEDLTSANTIRTNVTGIGYHFKKTIL